MSKRKSLAPIWSQPAPGSRRPRFTREQLAEVAIAIADKEGFDALSMRRLADELGAGTMTLYHYIRTKDDLIALVDDAIMGEVLVPELPSHWRAALLAIARRTRAVFVAHPWALYALQGARQGPNGMRHFEQSLAAVASLDLALPDSFALLTIVDDYVFGHSLRAGEERTHQPLEDPNVKMIIEVAEAQLATGNYPEIERLLGPGNRIASWRRITKVMSSTERFETGLEVMLDGAARRWNLPPDEPATPRSARPAPPPARRRRGA